MIVRNATTNDLSEICKIYNEVIANTTAAYRDQPVQLADRLAWFEGRQRAGYPVLVATSATDVLGFSSLGGFRLGSCYRHTAELTVHVKAGERGNGIGSALVEALLAAAGSLGVHAIIASIDADNGASIRLFERLGFVEVAHFREVGFKFNRWLDLVFMERLIG